MKHMHWVLAVIFLGLVCQGNLAHAGNGRMVVAVTMSQTSVPWYSGNWRYWPNNHHLPDHKDASGRRDIGSNYYPAIGLFDDADPEYIEYACQLLAMAEVDAITAHHDSFKNEWHNQAARRWFPILKRYGLQDAPRGGGQEGVEGLERVYKLFQPDILTISNRGVYVFFGIKMPDADIAAWKNTYPANQRPFVIRVLEGVGRNKPVGAAIDGAYGWIGRDTTKNDSSRTGCLWANNAEQAQSGYRNEVWLARKLLAEGSLHWYADGVSPGFNDKAVNGWGGGPRYVERADGETYRYRWQHACENGFPAVFIPTWDDWGEGSIIAPTVEFGNQYLEITRTYAAKYKGIPVNHGNFDVPKWIYTIRKRTDDPQILTAMKQACDLMQQRKYAEAEAFVQPYVKALQITSLPTYWEWTAQHRVK